MPTLEDVLRCSKKFGPNPCEICPRTVHSKLARHGEKIIILVRPQGSFSLNLVIASCWKPPEERNEIEKITCPWQKPF